MKSESSLQQIIKLVDQKINQKMKGQLITKSSSKTSEEANAIYQNKGNNNQSDKLETYTIPKIMSMFKKRLTFGGTPVKLNSETGLYLYIETLRAYFGDDDFIDVPGTNVLLSTYTEDRWCYVYLKSDGTYTVNKYAYYIGSNVDYIPISKVWVENGATTYDRELIVDLRPVGIGSAGLNHKLRQVFLSLFQSIMGVFLNQVTVVPLIQSGGLYVTVGSTGDKILYAGTHPLAETDVTLPLPESGITIDYYIIAKASVDSFDPDDLTFTITYKDVSSTLSVYEIPLAIVKGITVATTDITSDMIETIGYQRQGKDLYTYELEFNESSGGSHTRQHSITSTLDHTSTATPDQILKANSNGLPVDSSITESQVSSAVGSSHTQNTDTALRTDKVTVDVDGNTTIVGELKIKVYSQETEPTLTNDSFMAIWINTSSGENNKTVLLFRRGTGDQVSVELS